MHRRQSLADIIIDGDSQQALYDAVQQEESLKYDKDSALPQIKRSSMPRLLSWLNMPCDPAPAALVRIAFALSMLVQLVDWSDMFGYFKESYLIISYPSVSWAKPVSPELGQAMLSFCFLAALALALGAFTRGAAVVCCVLFNWLYHICQSNRTPLGDLLSQVSVAGCLIHWGRCLSLDSMLRKRRRLPPPATPRWQPALLQVLLIKRYLCTAACKLGSDWLLRAQPIAMLLAAGQPITGAAVLVPWILSWGLLGLDLAAAYLLLQPGPHILALPAAALSCAGNALVLQDSATLLQALATLALFLPAVPRQLRRSVEGSTSSSGSASGRDADGPAVELVSSGRPVSGSGAAKGQELQPRRALASLLPLTLAACLVAWHAATPLLPVLLRPGPQSWTSEALPAPLHGAMHNKDGWLYLVTEEEGGKVLELLPETDRLLAVAQLDAVMSGPQALLAYAARLQVVFGAAGRKLTAVKAVSCYRYNGYGARQLYNQEANLLAHLAVYQRTLGTGVGSFVHAWQLAPGCEDLARPDSRPGMVRRSRDAYEALQKAAGLVADVHHEEGGGTHQLVVHVGPGGAQQQWGYLWQQQRL